MKAVFLSIRSNGRRAWQRYVSKRAPRRSQSIAQCPLCIPTESSLSSRFLFEGAPAGHQEEGPEPSVGTQQGEPYQLR